MSEEDIDFLISIQDLEQPDFDNACLERNYEQLQKRINKAIEYIKNNTYFKDNVVKTMIFKDFLNELLEILGDKEIEEIPQFKGTLEELDNLTLGDKE